MTVVLAYVGQPLLRPQFAARATGAAPMEDHESRRDAAYAGIKELEFEHELGNLSDEDFQDLRDDYRHKAARVLVEMEAAASSATIASVEPELSPADEIEQAVMRLRQQRHQSGERKACPLCLESIDPDDRYCPNCGAALSRFCTECGEAREPADRFCRYCGALTKAAP